VVFTRSSPIPQFFAFDDEIRMGSLDQGLKLGKSVFDYAALSQNPGVDTVNIHTFTVNAESEALLKALDTTVIFYTIVGFLCKHFSFGHTRKSLGGHVKTSITQSCPPVYFA